MIPMQKTDTLIRTKLRPPYTRPELVPRPRLQATDRARAARSTDADRGPCRFWQDHPGGVLYRQLWVARGLAVSGQE